MFIWLLEASCMTLPLIVSCESLQVHDWNWPDLTRPETTTNPTGNTCADSQWKQELRHNVSLFFFTLFVNILYIILNINTKQ